MKDLFFTESRKKLAETFSHRNKKRKNPIGKKRRENKFLGVLFVTGKTFVHLEDGGLDEVGAKEAVLVEEVSHGLAERVLASFAGLAVAESQDQVVHVIESAS